HVTPRFPASPRPPPLPSLPPPPPPFFRDNHMPFSHPSFASTNGFLLLSCDSHLVLPLPGSLASPVTVLATTIAVALTSLLFA
ncbi:unnamed protein product, partial [Closterium sp. Naga37s-1]